MNYIIFDLEWNNAYNYKTKSGVNEIIEIGAIKLNDELEVVDTFTQLIYPRLSKKLGSRFKNLTHITLDEIKEFGIDFDDAFENFSNWCGTGDNVFLSWSMSDLYTLIDNFARFKNTTNIDFMKKYADAQRYCMSFIEGASNANQISLSNCAELLEIDTENMELHRALEDCVITSLCFKKLFDKNTFNSFVSECGASFFERLIFKPYFIKSVKTDNFDANSLSFECPICKSNVTRLNDYSFYNNSFKSAGKCDKCGRKFWINVRAKQTYDEVIVSKRLVHMSKKNAKKVK